jgi:hypothetical protein
MIVGLFFAVRRGMEAPRVAGQERMATEEVVRKVFV